MHNNIIVNGVVLGIIFCGISAAFDVYVANITQQLNPAIFIVYCFMLSSLVFIVISGIKKGVQNYWIQAKINVVSLLLVNTAVLLNWGGLILSLKYLEPAVVGIASVACGPVLTLVISRYIIKGTSYPSKLEASIAWIVLTSVILMLINSYAGKSGVIHTSTAERLIGIVCVIFSAVGTVLYTFFSKRLSSSGWRSYEVLGLRNILMLTLALGYVFTFKIPLVLDSNMLLIVLVLSVVGHIIPIFLIQTTISSLDPIHVSLILLLLPVFTLIFQFFDQRIIISPASIAAVIIITVLLIVLAIAKLPKFSQEGK